MLAKCVLTILELVLEPALLRLQEKIEHNVVQKTAKQVISRRRKNKNVDEMKKNKE